nr:N-acetylmuramoyl-L-alanine amidase [Candidatus Gracilibacteria bacterium]
MSKIFVRFLLIFFVTFTFFHIVSASDDIKIITRSEWGADETWRYADSDVWKNYFDRIYNESEKEDTEAELKQKQRTKDINNYLSTNYKDDNTLSEVIKEQNGHQLFWPIQKTNYVKAIVVHHTDTATGMTSIEAIRSIYKYHTLTRGWGDIGYNYLIGFDGEIFEGRAGGDYVVGAHALRNNRSTVGISIIGKYEHEKISDKQYESLKKLIIFLANKYGIDVSKQYDYHRDCNGNNCSFYIESYKDDVIVGHRDVGHTNCPGEELYKQLQILKTDLTKYTAGFTYIKNKGSSNLVKSDLDSKLDKLGEYNLLKLLAIIDYKLDKTDDKNLKKLRSIVYTKINEKNNSKLNISKFDYDKISNIKVKLSYPYDDSISIKKGKNIYDIKVSSGKLLINNKLELDKVTIKSLTGSYLEIASWNRVPIWDKENKYNDNKFRGNIYLYIENGKLVVVNELPLSDYLKGLGEVSDTDNPEKIKTIIIAARTYARWYMTKSNKFPGELYQASDNPDEFQRYLGYGLELRSPNINRIVDQTENQVITYNSDIIKPWYFSQSEGKTLSFSDYCKEKVVDCKSVNYPYLSSVFDPGSVGKTKLGHGVGISGLGATYLAKKGWTSDMIIKYYLKGVKIKSI